MKVAFFLLAGHGQRLSSDIKKQFIQINDKDLFLYALKSFEQSEIDKILIVTSKEDIDYVKEKISTHSKILDVIKGGETRKQSVYNALIYLSTKVNSDDIILIHDAARPLVSVALINDVIKTTVNKDCCSVVLPLKDTIIETNEGQYSKTLNRENLYSVQTPQGFRYDIIYKAHLKALNVDASDDAQLVKNLGYDVTLVKGEQNNFKVTTKEDLDYLKFLLKEEC